LTDTFVFMQLVPILTNHFQFPDNWNLSSDTWRKTYIGSKFMILKLKIPVFRLWWINYNPVFSL